MLTLSLDEKSGDLDTDSLAAAGIGPLVGSNGHSYAPRRNRATGSTIAGWPTPSTTPACPRRYRAAKENIDRATCLSAPVKAVRQVDGGVEVTLEDGEKLEARAVVSAVPMNILEDIHFSPALPAGKIEPSRQKHAGHGTKVHILLKGEVPLVSMWAPGGKVPLNYVLWEGIQGGNTHVIGFGPTSDTLDINDPEAVQAAVRQFIPGAEVLEAYGYDWTIDPYSKGVWGVSKPGQMSRYLKDLQEPMGRVIFANSDWANGWRGFIDGAIEQGIIAGRAAAGILGK